MWELETHLCERTRATGYEYGAICTTDGGQVGSVRAGSSDTIHFGGLVQAWPTGERFVMTHTHPSGGTFSPEDVYLLVNSPGLCGIRAIAPNGVVYILAKPQGYAMLSLDIIKDAFSQGFVVVHKDVTQRNTFENLPSPIEFRHMVMASVASRLGLKYTKE